MEQQISGEPERYSKDVRNTEVYVLNAGHFALDTKAEEIAALVGEFVKSESRRRDSSAGEKWRAAWGGIRIFCTRLQTGPRLGAGWFQPRRRSRSLARSSASSRQRQIGQNLSTIRG
jgi:hypothetical protein